MEHVERNNLFQLIRKRKSLKENEAFYYFVQVVSGIYFLHQHGIVHRDLKPENLLISSSNQLKICDFGWSAEIKGEKRKTYCGTLEYMAPEMLQEHEHDQTLDVWSLGILLYEMVHGKAPYQGDRRDQILQQIISKKPIQFKQGLSVAYKDLVQKLLQVDPSERLQLILVFNHPWVRYFEQKYNITKQGEEEDEFVTEGDSIDDTTKILSNSKSSEDNLANGIKEMLSTRKHDQSSQMEELVLDVESKLASIMNEVDNLKKNDVATPESGLQKTIEQVKIVKQQSNDSRNLSMKPKKIRVEHKSPEISIDEIVVVQETNKITKINDVAKLLVDKKPIVKPPNKTIRDLNELRLQDHNQLGPHHLKVQSTKTAKSALNEHTMPVQNEQKFLGVPLKYTREQSSNIKIIEERFQVLKKVQREDSQKGFKNQVQRISKPDDDLGPMEQSKIKLDYLVEYKQHNYNQIQEFPVSDTITKKQFPLSETTTKKQAITRKQQDLQPKFSQETNELENYYRPEVRKQSRSKSKQKQQKYETDDDSWNKRQRARIEQMDEQYRVMIKKTIEPQEKIELKQPTGFWGMFNFGCLSCSDKQ